MDGVWTLSGSGRFQDGAGLFRGRGRGCSPENAQSFPKMMMRSFWTIPESEAHLGHGGEREPAA